MVATFPITIKSCQDETGNFAGIEIHQSLGEDGFLVYSVTPAHPGPHKQALHPGLRRTQIYPNGE